MGIYGEALCAEEELLFGEVRFGTLEEHFDQAVQIAADSNWVVRGPL